LIVSSRKIYLKDESLENIEIPKMTVYIRHSDEKVF
jgi:Cu/Ag efflux protein CusF